MEPLKQKTESIEEVKEKIRRKNRENKEKNKQSDKSLKAIIIITILITIIVIAVVLIKNIPNAANTIEDEIYYATGVGIDINSDGVTHRDKFIAYKPVIYLYPEKETTVNVKLDINGELLYTYPEYNNTWKVKAKPNGTLINTADNKEYNYLFWEASLNTKYDLSKGFVVKGENTTEFLQKTLAKMGLTPKEYNEFIVYWLPQMKDNKYNLITFQQEAYTDNAKLVVQPAPDSVLRVFMVYKPLDKEISIEEPKINTFERKGFTLVEWGGVQLN